MKFFQISILIISLVVFSCSNSKENKKVFTVFSGTISLLMPLTLKKAFII